tara:strand:+ start:336 stop:1175 length:840 start_codon:yes stop_codon:yes gene_type:complete
MATDLEIINSALTKLGAGLITSDQKTNGSTKEARLAVERLPHVRKSIIRSHPWNFAIKRADSVTITSTASDAQASGTTLAVEALDSALPVNLAITFSGGGVFTITPNAIAAEATSIVGNLTVADIASGETASTWTSVGSALANTAPDFEYSYSIPLPTDFLRLLDVYDSDGEYRIEGSNLICNQASPDILYIYDVTDYSKIDPTTVEAIAWGLAHDMSYAITQSQQVFAMTQQGYRQSLATARTTDAQEDGRYYVEANLFDESRFGSSIFTDYRNHHRP